MTTSANRSRSRIRADDPHFRPFCLTLSCSPLSAMSFLVSPRLNMQPDSNPSRDQDYPDDHQPLPLQKQHNSSCCMPASLRSYFDRLIRFLQIGPFSIHRSISFIWILFFPAISQTRLASYLTNHSLNMSIPMSRLQLSTILAASSNARQCTAQ